MTNASTKQPSNLYQSTSPNVPTNQDDQTLYTHILWRDDWAIDPPADWATPNRLGKSPTNHGLKNCPQQNKRGSLWDSSLQNNDDAVSLSKRFQERNMTCCETILHHVHVPISAFDSVSAHGLLGNSFIQLIQKVVVL